MCEPSTTPPPPATEGHPGDEWGIVICGDNSTVLCAWDAEGIFHSWTTTETLAEHFARFMYSALPEKMRGVVAPPVASSDD